jgi:hypothetical protein
LGSKDDYRRFRDSNPAVNLGDHMTNELEKQIRVGILAVLVIALKIKNESTEEITDSEIESAKKLFTRVGRTIGTNVEL